ncbi:MAG: hypothetical protein VX196_04905, partial [Pseudomonadota bacterium]|nr:hypothetical protein [Pseudomonadota bacterium]
IAQDAIAFMCKTQILIIMSITHKNTFLVLKFVFIWTGWKFLKNASEALLRKGLSQSRKMSK